MSTDSTGTSMRPSNYGSHAQPSHYYYPIDQKIPINWSLPPVVAQTTWHESTRNRRIIGVFMLVFSAACAGVTYYAKKFLLATPNTVFATYNGSIILAGLSAFGGIIIMLRRASPNDLAAQVKLREAAGQRITNANPPLNLRQMRAEYPDEKILSNDDINKLFHNSLAGLSYDDILDRWGQEVVEILNENNKEHLQRAFAQKLQQKFNELKSNQIDYQTFTQSIGQEGFIQLTQQNRDSVPELRIHFMGQSLKGLVSIFDQNHQYFLNITNEEISKKALKETRGMPIYAIMRDIPDLFKWRILCARSCENSEASIELRLLNEIDSIKTFDELVQTYTSKIFEYHLIANNQPKLCALVQDFIIQSSNELLIYPLSNVRLGSIIEQYQLLTQPWHKQIQDFSTLYILARNEYSKRKETHNESYRNRSANMDRQKSDEIAAHRLHLGLQTLQDRVNQLKQTGQDLDEDEIAIKQKLSQNRLALQSLETTFSKDTQLLTQYSNDLRLINLSELETDIPACTVKLKELQNRKANFEAQINTDREITSLNSQITETSKEINTLQTKKDDFSKSAAQQKLYEEESRKHQTLSDEVNSREFIEREAELRLQLKELRTANQRPAPIVKGLDAAYAASKEKTNIGTQMQEVLLELSSIETKKRDLSTKRLQLLGSQPSSTDYSQKAENVQIQIDELNKTLEALRKLRLLRLTKIQDEYGLSEILSKIKTLNSQLLKLTSEKGRATMLQNHIDQLQASNIQVPNKQLSLQQEKKLLSNRLEEISTQKDRNRSDHSSAERELIQVNLKFQRFVDQKELNYKENQERLSQERKDRLEEARKEHEQEIQKMQNVFKCSLEALKSPITQ